MICFSVIFSICLGGTMKDNERQLAIGVLAKILLLVDCYWM